MSCVAVICLECFCLFHGSFLAACCSDALIQNTRTSPIAGLSSIPLTPRFLAPLVVQYSSFLVEGAASDYLDDSIVSSKLCFLIGFCCRVPAPTPSGTDDLAAFCKGPDYYVT
ncbi:hypothetical protein CC78DRAFT_585590 [Lojkania enalia]|uniref:Secreted protein n=1 Tax=Lojkania enalia TaxID=147567 RepID=A0A9P4JYV2_9PLEO|nr:hypothetical protein CC78DRAFT_585590 [Didymosphaeria enalia]